MSTSVTLASLNGTVGTRRAVDSEANLYRLGVPDMVFQRILRHSNVSTTATYYIKTAADEVRQAMAKLENHIDRAGQVQSNADEGRTSKLSGEPSTVQ